MPSKTASASSSASCLDRKQAKMHILATVHNLLSAQINHFQLLFLLRAVEMLGEITTFLAQDVRHILNEEDSSSVCVGFIAPQVDLSLLMPAVNQSRDYIGGDLESHVPDSNTSVYTARNINEQQPSMTTSASDITLE